MARNERDKNQTARISADSMENDKPHPQNRQRAVTTFPMMTPNKQQEKYSQKAPMSSSYGFNVVNDYASGYLHQ